MHNWIITTSPKFCGQSSFEVCESMLLSGSLFTDYLRAIGLGGHSRKMAMAVNAALDTIRF